MQDGFTTLRRSALMVLSICALAGWLAQPARADLITGNPTPRDQTLSEHQTGGFVEFTVINTGPNSVTIVDASTELNRILNTDTFLDAIGGVIPPVLCFQGDSRSPFIGKRLGFRDSCDVFVNFKIIDNDPFDELNPVEDVGRWQILLLVSAVDQNNMPVGTGSTPATVRITDGPVPEPPGLGLVLLGLSFLAVVQLRRLPNRGPQS